MFKKTGSILFAVLSLQAFALEYFEKKWDGLYLGANVGALFNQVDIDSRHTAFADASGTCNRTSRFNSAYIGPKAGFTHQLQTRLVFGIEGDFTHNFNANHQINCDCDFYPEYYDQFTASNNNQGSIRGRLGYALEHNLLPYFTGGASFANMALSYSNEVSDNYYYSTIIPGWTVGGGIEWAYTPKISFRLDYFYNQYNSLSMPISTIYGLNDSSGQGHLTLANNRIQAAISIWYN